MSDLMWFVVSCTVCIFSFLIIETIFYFLKKIKEKKTWFRCDSIERRLSELQKESNDFYQKSYIFKEDFKDLEKKIHQMEIEFTKIQIRFEERQTKQPQNPQITYKNPVGRPTKASQEALQE